MRARKYKIVWSKLIHAYNKRNVGRICQKSLAETFGVTGATICYAQTRGMTEATLNRRYKAIYEEHFESIIPLKSILE